MTKPSTMRPVRSALWVLCISMLGVGLACGGEEPGPTDPPPQDPGTLAVTTSTGGSFLDSNGYTFAVSGGAEQPIGVSDTESLSVAATSHTVVIGNIAPQCNVTNGFLTQTVNVQENQTSTVVFDLECGPPELGPDAQQQLCVRNEDNGGEALDITEGTAVIGAVAGLLNSSDACPEEEGGGGLTSWYFERWHVAVSTPGTYAIVAEPEAGLDVVLRVFEVLNSEGDTAHVGSSDQGGTGVLESLVLLLQGLGGGSASVSSGDGVLLSASSEFGYLVEVATLTDEDAGSYDLTANPTTEPPPPAPGAIRVTTTTTGDSPDPDGYSVTLAGKEPRPIDTNDSWLFDGLAAGSYTVELSGLAPNCSVSDPSRDVILAAGQTISVSFSVDCPGDPPVTLTVQGSGTGDGTVTGLGINCSITAGATSGICSLDYDYGTSVTLTPTAEPGSDFTGWSGSGCSGTGGCTVSMTAARTVTAAFEAAPGLSVSPTSLSFSAQEGTNPSSKTFSVQNTGGGSLSWSASDNKGWLSVSPTSGSLTAGQSATVTVSVSSASLAVGSYSGTVTVTGGGTTRSVSVGLTVTQTPQHTLAVSGLGNGNGTVTSSSGGINCTITAGAKSGICSAEFDEGVSVTLTASAATGSDFTGWSGGGCSGTGTCTVSMTAARSVTAAFTLESRTLTVNGGGSGNGTVTGSGINCSITGTSESGTCSKSFAYGTSVTLTPAAAAGSDFAGWSGACAGTGSCSVTMTQNRTVTAIMQLLNPPSITTGALPVAHYNRDYQAILEADGGTGTLTWSKVSGNLPLGLTLSTSGVIGGSFIGGDYEVHTFSVRVEDENGLTDTKSLSISAQWCETPAPPTLMIFLTIEGRNPESQSITLSDACGASYSWSSNPDDTWIQVSPASGTVGPNQSVQVTISVDGTGFGVGDNFSGVSFNLGAEVEWTEVYFTVDPNIPAPAEVSGMGYTLVGQPGVCGIPNSSRIQYTFDYCDPNGDVNGGTVRVEFFFNESFEYTSEPAFNSVVDNGYVMNCNSGGAGYSGTVTADNCITFGSSSSIYVQGRLIDQAGDISNTVGQTVTRPDSSYP